MQMGANFGAGTLHSAVREHLATRRTMSGNGGILTEYQDNPLGFAHDILGSRSTRPGVPFAWEAQRYIMEAITEHQFVSVRGCRGLGKSKTIGGFIIPWWFYTGLGRVIAMAPTERQILKVVWGEVQRSIADSPISLPGSVAKTELRIDEHRYALAIPCRNPDSLRGFHAGIDAYGDPDKDDPLEGLTVEQIERLVAQAGKSGVGLLIVIDEPEAISQDVFDVLRGMLNKPNVKIVMIGNPMLGVDDDHEFVRAFEPDSHWHSIHVSGFPLADFPDQMHADKRFDHVPAYLISDAWRAGMLKDYEPTDPIFLSDGLGQFSPGSTTSLVIPRTALESGIKLWHENRRPLGPRMGVDIGTGGTDPCVASLFVDGRKVSEKEWSPASDDREAQVNIARRIMALSEQWGRMVGEHFPDSWNGEPIPGERISIDDSGNVGVGDFLSLKGLDVDRVKFGAGSQHAWSEFTGSQLFLNMRAELHWNARRLLQEGIACIPRKWKKSWKQAQWPHFERDMGPDGPVIKIEKKEDIKAEHGRSPDNLDADMLALRPTIAGMQYGSAGSTSPIGAAQANAHNDHDHPAGKSMLRTVMETKRRRNRR